MNLSDLKKRVYVSLIVIVFLFLLIYFSSNLFVKIGVLFITVIVAAIALWEYAQFFISKKIKLSSKTMIVLSSALIISFFLPYRGECYSIFPIAVIFFSAVIFFLMRFNDISNAMIKIASEFFGMIYIAIPLSLMLIILYFTNVRQGIAQDGRYWILYLILVTKITDVGAYFIGRLFGKHKLAPLLSPKKTVEGAVAGLFCSVGLSFLISLLSKQGILIDFTLRLNEALFLGFFIGVLGQIGDLSESLFKRDALVKDSNKLPGLGGILDMIDSLLFTTPFLYFFLKLTASTPNL